MNPRTRNLILVGAAAIGLPALIVNGVSAETTTKTESVALQGAQTASVALEMDAGELNVHGGAATGNLLSGDFTYDGDDWKPEIDYSVNGTHGDLSIEPDDDDSGFNWPWEDGDGRGVWDVSLNDAIPTQLDVDGDAAEVDLALGGMNVSTLDVTADASQTTIDLTGAWAQNLTARIDADASAVTILLPTDVGVRIETDFEASDLNTTGLTEESDDTYVNAAYGASPITLTISIEADAADVKLEVAQ